MQVKSITVPFTAYSSGSVREVDGVADDHHLVTGRGKIRERKMAASGKFRGGRLNTTT